MVNTVNKLEIPSGTKSKLDAFRKRVWMIKLAEGLFAAACGLVLSYLLVFILDRFVDTPMSVRTTILLLGSAGLGIWFPLKCHKWVWRTRRFDQLARLLKHRMPRLSDRMLGIIELADNDIEQQRSAALCSAALKQVDDDIRDKTFDDAVPHPRHIAWGWAAGIPCALALIALVTVPAAGTNALARWLMPWKQTARYTFTQLEALPDEIVVPYAEPFPLTTSLAEKTAWSPTAGSARIDQQLPVETARSEKDYHFEFPAQKEPGKLTVAIGDARKTVAVEPKTRPELKELVANIRLPDYLKYKTPLTQDVRGGEISIVKGSKASFKATTSRELAMASLNGIEQLVNANTILTAPTDVLEASEAEFTWADRHGLTAKQPFKLNIQANDDRAPSVFCTQLAAQQVVLQEEVLKFELSAEDDFGILEIGLQWKGIVDPLANPNPAEGEAIIMGGQPEETELQATGTFCAAREGISPQTLELRLFANDYLPNRERVYSTTYIVHVLSAEDHAIWLTEQLRRWSRQAQSVYEREHQLYENNKALRAMSAEELNSTKSRQQIETQAAAERTNARRLSAVTAGGKELLREATKNDQFNVATMENLASMLNTLEELSKNRMPSVADLLSQAANAQPGPGKNGQPGGPSDQPPKPMGPKVGNMRDSQSATDEGKATEEEEEADADAPPLPSIVDVESNMNSPDKEQPKKDGEKPPSKGSPTFGLPQTTIIGGGPPDPEQEEAESPPQEKLDEAIAEQEDLLDEFSKVADELQRILNNLEGSTFVKRLKAASRRQLKIANELDASLAQSFGKRAANVDEIVKQQSVSVSDREVAESENLFVIQQDLDAYYNRVQQGKFLTVIEEMRDLGVTAKLKDLAGLVTDNFHGQSIAHSEFWADTFDRWGEQLVGPG